MPYKDRTMDAWDSPQVIAEDGPLYWQRTPPIPPLLRRAGSQTRKKDPATLDLFGAASSAADSVPISTARRSMKKGKGFSK
jgi:hypothetical protein